MAPKFEFNQIQQVIDACAFFLEDPENFIVNNHVHDVDSIKGLPEALDSKASKDIFKLHKNNKIIHITDEERARWNGMMEEIKKYVNEKFAEMTSFEIEVLPDGVSHESIKNPSTHTIYFEKKVSNDSGEVYNEYMYLNGSWELIGDTTIDLSNYYTKDLLYTKAELYNKEEIDVKLENFVTKFNEHINNKVSHLSKLEHDKLTALFEEEKVVECLTHLNFPSTGKTKTIYVAKKENATYRWDDTDMKYYCTGRDYETISIIDGGTTKTEDDTAV